MFIHRVATRAIVLGLVAVSFGACSSTSGDSSKETAEESSDDATIVAELELGDGTQVSFLEVEPGFMALRIRGLIDNEVFDPAVGEDESMAALYERLSGGEPAPPSLVEASERAASRRLEKRDVPAFAPETRAPLPHRSTDGVQATRQAISNDLTTEEFVAKYCPPSWYGSYWRWVNVTGSGSLLRSDVSLFQSAIMAFHGTVHVTAKYRPWYTWRNLADDDVPAGWYLYVTPGERNLDFDARVSVGDADGDGYNWCTKIL